MSTSAPSSQPSFIKKIDTAVVRFFSRHKTYTAFLFIMIIAIVFYAIFSAPKPQGETYTVTLGPIKQYVKVSGTVTSSKDANLGFQIGGAVAYVGVKTGDIVEQGRVLATLSAGDAQASVLQAEASLSNAQAVLEQLQQGARKEELAIKEQTLENAKSSLDQAYTSLPDTIQNVDAVTADVIKNKFASFFVLSGGRYQLSFSSCDQRLQGEIESKRTTLENTLAAFQKKSSVISAISSNENIDVTFEMAYQSAIATNDLVNAISNLLLSPCSVSNPALDGFRTSLSLVKTTMTTLFSDISAKRSALIVAKNTFRQANADLTLSKAGTDPYKIKAQAALVSQAEAQVATAKSGLDKTIIKAPFSGTVSNIDLSFGETVTVGKTVVSMLATDGFEIEAKVPEVDIVKIKADASVDITLDAYGKDIIFPAKVTRINPTATTEGTIPVYKVIVTFVGKDERIRQGMTANVQIITETKSKIVAVPSRFIQVVTTEKGNVTLLVNGKEVTKEVSLGIRGADGLLEVTGGLLEGDVLVAPTTADRQAQKQTS
jgi:RND family efflux transporter MFP subunit